MKLCLVMAFQNERPWLALHLPVLLKSTAIDGLIMLDGGSTDGDVVDLGEDDWFLEHAVVCQRRFDWNFATHFNFLVEMAEDCGYDALLRLDPDELMFPEHVDQIKALLESHPALLLPRFNFEPDRAHYVPGSYPDYQARAWRLREGVRYVGPVHEVVNFPQSWVTAEYAVLEVPHLPIFHYGNTHRDFRWWLKQVNYGRIWQGLPLVGELPPTHPHGPRFNLPFVGRQPLDPAVVGLHAPFEDGGLS